jgi:hypothetical protein
MTRRLIVTSRNFIDYYGKHDQFHFTDLNAVMKAVQDYCSSHDLFVSSCLAPGLATWQVHLFKHGFDTSLGPDYSTLNEALLAACVEAARKLKAS